MRYSGLLLGALLILAATRPLEASEQSTKINIVFILADDLGYADLGCYGCPDIKTPNIDRLAKQGVRLRNFYSNGPECTPTRTALMTGRYQQRVGGMECALGLGNVGRYDDAIRLREKNELGLPSAENSLVRLLRGLGYYLGIIGKWHLGYETKFLPGRYGFDYAFGPLGGGVDYFHHTEPGGEHVLMLNDKPVRREGYLTDLITDEASKFIQRSKEKPFFLFVPSTAPHHPYQGLGDKKDQPLSAKEASQGSREKYCEMVERLDHGVGKILQALDDAKLADKTLVIFTSDNGGWHHARNAPFRGMKGGLFEGGVRVPCIVRWPGVVAASKESDVVGITMDLTASIARVAGANLKDQRFDGVDIVDYLAKNEPLPSRPLFWRARRGKETWWAVRDGTLKYVAQQNGERKDEYLFDLARDVSEKDNLLLARPDDGARLRRMLTEWEKEVRAAR